MNAQTDKMKISKGRGRPARSAMTNNNNNSSNIQSSSSHRSTSSKSAVNGLKSSDTNREAPTEAENSKDRLNTSTPGAHERHHRNAGSANEKTPGKGVAANNSHKSTSSTPRVRKDPLANLHSNLSPKYIGFSTPKSRSSSGTRTPVTDERGRITRRKWLHGSAEHLNTSNVSDSPLNVSQDASEYVRRTDSSPLSSPCDAGATASAASKRRSFESPIEKLLRKNRRSERKSSTDVAVSAAAVFVPTVPKARKPIKPMELKVKVARDESLDRLHKNGIKTVHLDQHGKVITETSPISDELEPPLEAPAILKLREESVEIFQLIDASTDDEVEEEEEPPGDCVECWRKTPIEALILDGNSCETIVTVQDTSLESTGDCSESIDASNCDGSIEDASSIMQVDGNFEAAAVEFDYEDDEVTIAETENIEDEEMADENVVDVELEGKVDDVEEVDEAEADDENDVYEDCEHQDFEDDKVENKLVADDHVPGDNTADEEMESEKSFCDMEENVADVDNADNEELENNTIEGGMTAAEIVENVDVEAAEVEESEDEEPEHEEAEHEEPAHEETEHEESEHEDSEHVEVEDDSVESDKDDEVVVEHKSKDDEEIVANVDVDQAEIVKEKSNDESVENEVVTVKNANKEDVENEKITTEEFEKEPNEEMVQNTAKENKDVIEDELMEFEESEEMENNEKEIHKDNANKKKTNVDNATDEAHINKHHTVVVETAQKETEEVPVISEKCNEAIEEQLGKTTDIINLAEDLVNNPENNENSHIFLSKKTGLNMNTQLTTLNNNNNNEIDVTNRESYHIATYIKTKMRSTSKDKNDIVDVAKNKHNNDPNVISNTSDTTKDLDHSMKEGQSSAKSPSSESIDSAKGSSVNNDISWISFTVGDIFWGQIYTYCYWPCMVCPDPEGKTITTEIVRNAQTQHVMVHVRFFADNARRSWVKRENLLAYAGYENFMEKMIEAEKKYGKKSSKYKAFVVSKGKMRVWKQAIDEANLVTAIKHEERMEKFYEIYENTKVLNKLDSKRRLSIYTALSSTSDIGSMYDSCDNLSVKQMPAVSKRERSISPFSPAYSPVGQKSLKRRKVSSDVNLEYAATPSSTRKELQIPVTNDEILDTNNKDMETETAEHSSDAAQHLDGTLSLSTSRDSQEHDDIYNDVEFKKLFSTMKEYVMQHNKNDTIERSLVVAVRNIWALKHINHRQIQARAVGDSNAEQLGSALEISQKTDGSFKRLSTRLRNLQLRPQLSKINVPQISITSQLPPSRPKHTVTAETRKTLNRPIEEVIDDIFNLDNKYLFKGMSREPVCKYCYRSGGLLEKCSKNCQSWLHVACIGLQQKDQPVKRKHVKKVKISAPASLDDTTSSERSSYALHITADDVAHAEELAAASSNSADSQEQPSCSNAVALATTAQPPAVCHECSTDASPKCMICHGGETKDEALVHCNLPHCQHAFHAGCCKYWPQAKITKSNNRVESVRCPSHVCHTCVSDDPKGKFQNISSAKLTKCIKCPASFHTDSTCIPAGSRILNAAYIICPRHSITKSDQKVNVNWCFICVGGGKVVCCETCPTAVHEVCLNIPINSEENYICEECETGRMPLYGEMVWAKYNNFRWWPAIILPPTEIPHNVVRMAHTPSDFVVRFFGTHDHGWISRRRVYLYLEGDSSEPPRSKSQLDSNYTEGVEEAKRIWEIIKTKKNVHRLTDDSKQKLHPQPYVKIKTNRAVAPLKLHIDLEKVSRCDCDKYSKHPCGPDTNCLNRVLYHECNPKLCPAGNKCENQMFESRISPKLDVVYMKARGFGLICREPISAGTFIIEYVGEVINDEEFKQRMTQKSLDRDENFYFLSLEKDYIIDAGPKGNLARFMNHSCDPNCETQKWSVNGLDRVGLFAITDIPADTEVTFNYHWDDLLGSEKKTCFCGAAKCVGQIGGKLKEAKVVKQEETTKDNKKTKNSKTKTTTTTKQKKPLKRLQNKSSKSIETGKKYIKIASKLKKKIQPSTTAAAAASSSSSNSSSPIGHEAGDIKNDSILKLDST